MTSPQTWDPAGYAENARFVSDLGVPVLELLAPRAGERILVFFAESFTRALPEGERAAFLEDVRARVAPRLRGPDGVWVADYVRLRFAARKPSR